MSVEHIDGPAVCIHKEKTRVTLPTRGQLLSLTDKKQVHRITLFQSLQQQLLTADVKKAGNSNQVTHAVAVLLCRAPFFELSFVLVCH